MLLRDFFLILGHRKRLVNNYACTRIRFKVDVRQLAMSQEMEIMHGKNVLRVTTVNLNIYLLKTGVKKRVGMKKADRLNDFTDAIPVGRPFFAS